MERFTKLFGSLIVFEIDKRVPGGRKPDRRIDWALSHPAIGWNVRMEASWPVVEGRSRDVAAAHSKSLP
jgi:hypothetical protein